MNLTLMAVVISLLLGVVRIWSFRRRGMGVVRALGLSLNRGEFAKAGMGAAIGIIAVAATFALVWATGSLAVRGIGRPAALVGDLLSFVAVPFQEELVFRAGLLGGLLVLLPRYTWAAVAASAAVFGGLHGLNQHATLLTMIGTTLDGVTYAIAFAATERLWLPFGLHFGWNYALGPVLGFALSGAKPVRGTFIQQESVGPAWFTGGEYGPEGGVAGFAGRTLLLLMVLLWLEHWRRKPHESGRSAARMGRGARAA